MKKKFAVTVLAAAMTMAMGLTAFADVGWIQSSDGRWWYSTAEDDSSWLADGADWLDGNKDGTAEYYYFDADGWMAQNETISGYYFNNDGQWEVDGVVQTQPSEYIVTSPGGTYVGDMSSRDQWVNTYTDDDGDEIELMISTGDDFGLIDYDTDKTYTMSYVSEGNYRFSSSISMTLNSDGTITYKNRTYYPD